MSTEIDAATFHALEDGAEKLADAEIPVFYVIGNHDIDVRYRATSGESQLALRVDGAEVAGVVPLPETDGVWRTAALAHAVPLRAGVQALRLSVVTPGVGLELHSLTPHR